MTCILLGVRSSLCGKCVANGWQSGAAAGFHEPLAMREFGNTVGEEMVAGDVFFGVERIAPGRMCRETKRTGPRVHEQKPPDHPEIVIGDAMRQFSVGHAFPDNPGRQLLDTDA